MEIRYVKAEDKDFWFRLDRHLPETEFDRKVRDRMGYVLSVGDSPAALLRYHLFWDNTPFCTMLFVDWEHQGKGYGWDRMSHWEEDMKKAGYGMVMVSTQVDEQAQHFYRKLGYQDAGGLVITLPGYEQPMELFLIKKI